MRIAQIQFSPWDKVYDFNQGSHDLVISDQVIVKTELGIELGKVFGFKVLPDEEEPAPTAETGDGESTDKTTTGKREIKPILRKATTVDLEKMPEERQKNQDLIYCRKLINEHKLPMKLVDLIYSFDGSRLTFAFIADGRVDFRDLVKDLSRHFNRTIRLQQIGIRDEAKLCGDYGHCGLPLCCGKFLKDLTSISSEMAELQQCVHRGSERISGVCGRLMCCLAYEEKGYKDIAAKMPDVDSEVSIEGKKGRIIARHVLKRTVEVKLFSQNGDGSDIIEVEMEKIRK